MAKLKSGFLGERAIVLPPSVIDEFKSSTLGSLLYITDIGFYPNAGFHFRKRNETEANQYILIYCVSGMGWFEVDGVKHVLKPEHFVILPKFRSHKYGSNHDDPWSIYWLHFDGSLANFFLSESINPIQLKPQIDSRIEDRLNLFEEIFLTLRNGYSKNNLDYSISVLFHFLGTLKYIGAFRENNYKPIKEISEIGKIDDAIHYMRENLHKKISLEDIFMFVDMSRSHFTAVFHRKTGFPPLQYFVQLKIQQACHYLDFTDMKVNEISTKMGFEDPLYFSRIFTKNMGLSPTEYRKKMKG